MFVLGIASSTAIALAEDRTVALPPLADLLAGYGAGVAIMLMWAALGGALGVLLRGVALPVGLGVVWVLGVENLVAGVASSVLTALAPLRDSPPGINTDVADGRALLTVACYIGACLAVAAWRYRRSDVA